MKINSEWLAFCDKREQKEFAHYAEWSKNLEQSEKCRLLTVDFI